MDEEDREQGRKEQVDDADCGAAQRDCEERSGGKRTATEAGYVYFLATKDLAFVKIGFSTSVVKRVMGLTIGPAVHGTRLIGSFPGTRQTEAWLHEKFAEYHDQGEWFHYRGPLLRFIRAFGFRGFKPERDLPVAGTTVNENELLAIVRKESRRCIESMMVAAVPEFRRRLAGEHVRVGLRAAQAKGKHIGRPRSTVDSQEVWRLRQLGMSWRVMSRHLNTPWPTIRKRFMAMQAAADHALRANAAGAEER